VGASVVSGSAFGLIALRCGDCPQIRTKVYHMLAALGLVGKAVELLVSTVAKKKLDLALDDKKRAAKAFVRLHESILELERRIAAAAPVSAQKPVRGFSFVSRLPIVWTIRQPPKNVPSAIAAWAARITQTGTLNS
jgi:hypothetical protein